MMPCPIPRKGGTTWPAERMDRLRALAAQGLTASEIARAMGLTRRMVEGRCESAGLALRKRWRRHRFTPVQDAVIGEIATAGGSRRDAALRLGLSERQVKDRAAALGVKFDGRYWGPARYAELRRLWLAGLEPREMAARMSTSRGAIWEHLKIIGLGRRCGPKQPKLAAPLLARIPGAATALAAPSRDRLLAGR